MYLVDTNVISTSAPTKRLAADSQFISWMQKENDRLFLSAITIAEIELGIVQLERREATTKAAQLQKWLQAIERLYGNRILSFDIEAARHAGIKLDRVRALNMGFADVAIAAIAGAHGLTILTANTKDFAPLGVRLLNPFLDDLPNR